MKTHYDNTPITTKPLRQNSPLQAPYDKTLPFDGTPATTPTLIKARFVLCGMQFYNPTNSIKQFFNFIGGKEGVSRTQVGIHFASGSGFVAVGFVVGGQHSTGDLLTLTLM